MFDFLSRAEKAPTLTDLTHALDERLQARGFVRFALGLIPPGRSPQTTVLLENLGEAWWSVADGGNQLGSRNEFIRLVRGATAPFFVPSWFNDAVNERLASAGLFYAPHPSLVVPTTTPAGVAYLILPGEPGANLTESDFTVLRELAVIAVHHWQRLVVATGDGPLTPRERETLSLVANGLSSLQIAAQLHVTERTVIAHIANSMRKLDARNRTAAVVQALKRGLIDI